jgi:hypothetical protein
VDICLLEKVGITDGSGSLNTDAWMATFCSDSESATCVNARDVSVDACVAKASSI